MSDVRHKYLHSPVFGRSFPWFLTFLLVCGIFGVVAFHVRRWPTPTTELQRRIVLWAWERPEDLRFVDTGVRVAYLAGSIEVQNGQSRFKPRKQPLRLNDDTPRIPVVRIDHLDAVPFVTVDGMVSEIGDDIVRSCMAVPKHVACQIDFDATESEQVFYADLMRYVRRALPSDVSLTITALASWCHAGGWLDDLPIDEAVPMMFDLGPDERVIREGRAGASFMTAKLCANSIGIATYDELPGRQYLDSRTIYVFSNRPWTQEAYRNILNRVSNP